MSAIFSEDRTRRYSLTRVSTRGSVLGFVMLNPSSADEQRDDATIRKCVGFAARWGFSGGIMVTNLIPVIATDPYALPPWSGFDRVNYSHITQALQLCVGTVVAWGSVPRPLARSIALGEHILRFRELAGTRPLFCIGLTKNGDPLHPSRTAYTSGPEAWEWGGATNADTAS
jgi:hypothetical protein